ncbi:MAG TPA: FISUMP domain-containing protein [Prolixibacteraceae bacterium]
MKTLKILFIVLPGFLLVISCGTGTKSHKTGTVNDIDGNSYPTVTLGKQVWMTENLITTKYNDGTPISNVKEEEYWKGLTTEAYCWFKNDAANKSTYGAYYNWYSVNTGKLCPAGWHVPSDKEWRVLTDFLGGEIVAGINMKYESGWSSKGNGTNSSGFSALPYGYRSSRGNFSSQALSAYFWSSSENASNAWYCVLFSKDGTAYKYYGNKESGFSVRCLKN